MSGDSRSRRLAVTVRHWAGLGYALPVLLWDQWTKAWALSLDGQHGWRWLGGICELRLLENHGAVGGLFANAQGGRGLPLVLAACGALLSGVLAWQSVRPPLLRPQRPIRERLGLGLMLGGVLGNTLDRVRWGYVVDFLHLRLGRGVELGTVNVADLAIFAGLTILMSALLRAPQRLSRPST